MNINGKIIYLNNNNNKPKLNFSTKDVPPLPPNNKREEPST